ncbi:MAG TPA: transposase [Candidatus Margulisbacteria bacterium]|nr:transposase [Candidatus Margulisiibacteriota bacterium]
MFRENTLHRQANLFDNLSGMDHRYKKKLENSWAGQFYKQVFCKINESLFEPLYCSDNGRPNFPINILVALEIIKHLKNYTDEVLFDAFAYDFQISYAVGLRNIGERYFARRTFYEFRARLYQYTLDHPKEGDLIFQQFETLVQHFIKVAQLDTDEQRMDSTQVMSNIKRAGRLALAYDVLLQAIKACPPEILSSDLLEVLDSHYKTILLYKLKDTEVSSRLEKLLNLGGELNRLMEDNEELQLRPELQILARFMKEQTIYDDQRKVWLAKENKEIAASSLQSAFDSEATFRKKAGKNHVGFAVNLTETCAEANPVQIVTDYQVEPNSMSDVKMADHSLERLQKTTPAKDLYVDGGYYSSDLIKKAESLGTELHYTDMTGRKAISNKLPYNAFNIINFETILNCPNSQKPTRSDFNSQSGILSAHFDRNICTQCPLKDQCPVKFQKKDTVLRFNQKSLIAETTRLILMDKKDRNENGSKRAAIEGTNSALKRARGAGKLRVRGLVRCTLTMGLKTIAHNFHQIVRFLQGDTRQNNRNKKNSATLQGILAPI